MHAGKRIRTRRLALRLKPSEIEQLSISMAVRLRDPRYFIAHSTLADIEAGSAPSVYKMLSLAYCLRLTEDQILDWYGIDLHLIRSVLRSGACSKATEKQDLAELSQHDVSFPFRWPQKPASPETKPFNPSFSGSESGLRKRFLYARTGSRDDSMMDIVPPGSLVRVDTQQRKVSVFNWTSLGHRPIYFVRHTFGYSCRWWQQNGSELMLIPHLGSRDFTTIYRMPKEVTILVRVVSIWTSGNKPPVNLPDET